MTDENKFNNLTAQNLSKEQEDSQSDDIQSPYALDPYLLNQGYDYDSSAIYVPYTFKYEEGEKGRDERDIYLKISRNPNKAEEMIYSWTSKEKGEYKILKTFSRSSLLMNEEIKTNKKGDLTANINKSISANGILVGLNKTDNSFREFFFTMIANISKSSSLEIFKNKDFEFPIEDDSEDSDEEDDKSDIVQCFDDYDEDIKKEALKISKEGRLFEELQNSIAITHEGHPSSRDSLILQETSVFIGDGVHGLLDGDSGEGKSDLSFVVGHNLPKKYVKILRNISPKNIYYDNESYNEDFNVLIFDDLELNDDIVHILKELSDNTKKVKELKTVVNGKAVKLTLRGKFVIILTYAKKLEDIELANRLFNTGVMIEDDEKSKVKGRIRDNNVIGGNVNAIIERTRLILQASIHDLIEKDMKVFNPFLSIFNPINFNNRDINHFINMTKTRTFFEYYRRGEIQINDDLSVTIGSFEDFSFVNSLWIKDSEAQGHKLSTKQKQILDKLPSFSQDEALDYVDGLSDKFNETESKKARLKLLEDEPTKKSLAKSLGINQNTLTNLLDKSHENSTSKSLIELGLVDKIQMEEISHNPNFYYKIKNEGEGLISQSESIETIEKLFQETFQSPLIKIKLIINLLYYCNILINEKGYMFLKKYCEEHDEKINIKDYESYFSFLQRFFKELDYDEYCIELDKSNYHDLLEMNRFKEEINQAINDEIQKKDGSPQDIDEDIFQEMSKKEEKSPNPNQEEKSLLKSNFNSNNKIIKGNGDLSEKINVKLSIAEKIFKITSSKPKNQSQIISEYCDGIDPSDVDDHHQALECKMNIKRLEDNDLLEIVSYTNKAKHYQASDEFKRLLYGDDVQ